MTDENQNEITIAEIQEEVAEETIEDLMADDESQEDSQDKTEEDTEEVSKGDEGDEGEAEKSEENQDDIIYVTEEINGVEYEIPEGVAKAIMQERDYTQGKQAIAEERKALAESQAALEADKNRTNEDLMIDAELARLESVAKQYDALNWSELSQNDLWDAQQKQFDRQLVKDEITRLTNEKNTRAQARQDEMQRDLAKRINDAETYAKVNIPGWQQGKDAELIQYAKDIGYDDATLAKNMGEPFIKMLHKAYVGEQALKRASEKPKPETRKAAPAKKVSSKSAGTNRKDPDNMSMSEYRQWRKS